MQTLVLGNGFDIDHELPTKYKNFLCFVEAVRGSQRLRGKVDALPSTVDTELKKYIYNLFFLDDKIDIKSEVLSLLESNIWIDYFLEVKGEFGENWIDFETEISQLVQELENVKDYVIDEMKSGSKNIDVPELMTKRLNKLSPCAVNLYKDGNEKDIHDFVSKLVDDLKRMIRLLEIYLSDYVQAIKIAYFSPDIYALNPDRVISFNYTNTYEKLYSYKKSFIKYNYIHGKALSDSSVDTCNMVLGIDEYLDGDRKTQKTEFIQFKKYFQRVHKKTDCEYVYWFDKELRPEKNGKEREEVFIFGHSLDITDGDVLSTIINCPNTYVTIFYHDDVDYGKQIANLVSLLGQDILLSKVYGKNPSIIFKHQREHTPISHREFEVSNDMYKLRHLYEYSNVQAQKIVNGVVSKIDSCNISYFVNQKNIINMYDILQELGIAEKYRGKLLSFAKVFYDEKLSGQKIHIDATQWGYWDYDGYHDCDGKTRSFINEINKYNLKEYEKHVFTIQDGSNKEEMYLKYPNKIRNGYSIDDYEKTFRYALNKMNSTEVNTREVLNALCTIALQLDKREVMRFYSEKKKSSNNPVFQSRIRYIITCYEEDLYMEYQEMQYQESLNNK